MRYINLHLTLTLILNKVCALRVFSRSLQCLECHCTHHTVAELSLNVAVTGLQPAYQTVKVSPRETVKERLPRNGCTKNLASGSINGKDATVSVM